MRIRTYFLLFIFLFCLICNLTQSFAQEPTAKPNSEIETKIKEYEKKLAELGQQKNTLASQIQTMDTQIYLTGLKIQDSEHQITETEKEIETLTTRIGSLDNSLSKISKLLIKQIAIGYKKRSVSFFNIILDSNNAGELINTIKYQKTVQNTNQRMLVQVQDAKSNYEEQKLLRETKKKQLDLLIITLARQKTDLTAQQQQKENLLAATQSSEVVYQGLLEKAKQELQGFSSFVQYAGGGGLTSFGNGSNGWYFTQRDPSWGNITLPGSSSSLALAGCAVTSVAMVCKSFGQDISPVTIANNPSNFIGGDLWNWAFSCSGQSSSGFIYLSKENIKSYIKDKNARVIIRLISPSVSGLHFIVGWKWDDEKDDLIIHDPYHGPDLAFSLRYNWGQITNGVAIY